MLFGEFEELRHKYVLEVVELVLIFLVELGEKCVGCFVLLCLDGTREEVGADDNALERGRCLKRSVLDIAGLVAEDGTEKFLLGGGVRLSFGSDLTDHDVTGHDMCADTYDTALVEVFGGVFAEVGDIGGEFFHTALGLAHLE